MKVALRTLSCDARLARRTGRDQLGSPCPDRDCKTRFCQAGTQSSYPGLVLPVRNFRLARRSQAFVSRPSDVSAFSGRTSTQVSWITEPPAAGRHGVTPDSCTALVRHE